MADVVGLLTSILQLVDTVATVVIYVKDFKNASEEQQRLLSEVQSLRPLLQTFQTQMQGRNCSQQLKKPLIQFEDTMQQLVNILGLKGTKLSTRLRWTLWNKKEAAEDLGKIERFKSLLNTWLTLEFWNEQRKVNDSVDREGKIEWLSPLNFFPRQADIFGAREQGTGNWLLEDERFEHWKSTPGQVMWCRGMPGAGKTVLASLVVNHLQAEIQKANLEDEIGVACMYLNHKETQIQSPSNLLASLWRQLILGKSIPHSVHELFKHHRERGTRPFLADVQDVLRSAVAEYSKVYLIVDALDEYPEDLRDILLDNLGKMGPNVNLMLTSRPHITIDASFPIAHVFEIRATHDDIRLYVQSRILKSSRLTKHVKARPELRDEIENMIVDSVDGMFLLAKLHVDSLATKLTAKAVREALRSLPKDLEHTYDEAMERINSQNQEDRNIARLILIWITNARRPLYVSELQEALAVEPGAKTLDDDNMLDVDIILAVCGGLVTVNETDPVVRLIHYTAQDYLDGIQAREFPDAQTDITSSCLTYLSFTTFASLPQSVDDKHRLCERYALLAYAAEYCLVHAGGQPERVLKDSLLKFLQDSFSRFSQFRWGIQPPWNYGRWPTPVSSLWVAAFFNLQEMARHLLAHGAAVDSEEDMDKALYVASDLGHLEIVEMLILNGADANAPRRGELRDTALYAASFKGHEAVARLLIKSGADVNAEGGRLGAALDAAAWAGHETVIELLLQKGADVRPHKGQHYGNALQTASFKGHTAVVRLLIDSGIDVNAEGGRLGTALQAASSEGREAVVRLLLENGAENQEGCLESALQAAAKMGHEPVARLLIASGADVNARSDPQDSALYAASFNGHERVARFLLDNGADVNAEGGQFGNALQAACAKGNEAMVRMLIEKGADVNMKSGRLEGLIAARPRGGHRARYFSLPASDLCGTALQVAAASGREAVVRLLIESGADVNAEGNVGPALQAASAMGHYSAAKLLIEHGADVNPTMPWYSCQSPLYAASLNGQERVVQLLLESGADINATGGKFGGALQAASSQGNESMVRLLIEKGANVNGKVRTTPLYTAVKYGHVAIVRLLIEKGAKVNAGRGIALNEALLEGHEDVVRLFLENGADINAPGGGYGGALQGASSKGNVGLVRLLLENGADINAQGGGEEETALQAASCSGSVEVARLLLEKGANVNAQGGRFGTALQAASYHGKVEVATLLLEHGADVNARGGELETALQAAFFNEHEKVVRLLIEHGADASVLQ
ncbi:ankyrin repeat-containing domain protein [Mycena vulgaris]|nr:ankyrin repeat-containing domain protein [Mycena vulgaris]